MPEPSKQVRDLVQSVRDFLDALPEDPDDVDREFIQALESAVKHFDADDLSSWTPPENTVLVVTDSDGLVDVHTDYPHPLRVVHVDLDEVGWGGNATGVAKPLPTLPIKGFVTGFDAEVVRDTRRCLSRV